MISDKNYIDGKLMDLLESPAKLRKIFKFTAENLKDNPNVCFEEIQNYVNEHESRIEDFFFEDYVDENTFEIVIVMHILIKNEFMKLRHANSILNMLSDEMKIAHMHNVVEETMKKYAYEFNTESTRATIINHLNDALEMHNLSMRDVTTSEMVDRRTLKFMIKYGGMEYAYTF